MSKVSRSFRSVKRSIASVFGGVAGSAKSAVVATETAVVAGGSAVANTATTVGSKVKGAIFNQFSFGMLVGGVMSFLSSMFGPQVLPVVQNWLKPPAVTQPAPAPVTPPTAPAPAPVAGAPAAPPTIPVPPEKCYEARQAMRTVKEIVPQKWVGEESGHVIYKPRTVYRQVPQTIQVEVPCPPQPSKEPPAVVSDTPMYGLKGLGGVFDEQAFRDFAAARGYNPVVIKDWDEDKASAQIEAQLKKHSGPYAIYGFGYGAKTAKTFVSGRKGSTPSLVVLVSPSMVVNFNKAFPPETKVEAYFHKDTKHDTEGVYIEAPTTGKGNIQQVIAKMAQDKTPVTVTPPTK